MELKFFLQFSFCGRHRKSVSDYSTQTAHVKQLLTSTTFVIYLGGVLQVVFQKILLKVQIQLRLNSLNVRHESNEIFKNICSAKLSQSLPLLTPQAI